MKIRLQSVPVSRALMEGWGIMAGFSALLALTPGLGDVAIGEGVNLALFFASAWPGLRASRPGLSRSRNFLIEVGTSLLLTLGLAAILVFWHFLPGVNSLIENNSFGSAILLIVLGLTSPAYLFWRLALWGWGKWQSLRRRRFMWSINHAMLSALSVLVLVLVGVFGAVAFPTLVNPDSNIFANALALIIQVVFILVLVLPAIFIPILLVLLPVMAVTAYTASRNLARRLETLAHAAQQLSAGDLRARSIVEGEDEIAQLQRDFNHMAEELEKASAGLLAERDRVTTLLKNQRELTASASHELRTPLAIMSGHLEQSLDAPNLPPEIRQNLAAMQAEGQRMQNLIEDLFTLSRAEVNRLSLNLESFDLLPVIQQTVDAVAPLTWRSRKVSVIAHLPEECPPVHADRLRVEQVLRNLLQNGARYTPPGGIVAVDIEIEEHEICMQVHDTGEGIDSLDLPHIWEKFYQGRNASGEFNSGLGLAIVRELSETMHGRVAVQSVVGEGSRFSVWLPRAAE